MNLGEFIKRDEDVDVYDSDTDNIYAAISGPIYLTKEGSLRFADILNRNITINATYSYITVDTTTEINDIDAHLRATLKRFTEYAAGYCSAKVWLYYFRDHE